jgi:hypothetical protein
MSATPSPGRSSARHAREIVGGEGEVAVEDPIGLVREHEAVEALGLSYQIMTMPLTTATEWPSPRY